VSDAAMLSVLMEELKKKQSQCLKPGLDEAQTERCVWLTYAPGASAAGASQEAKEALAKLTVAQFEAPYPKVREVAVETLTATNLASYAPALKKLIQKEKNGGFSVSNGKALIGRFQTRLKTLKRAK